MRNELIVLPKRAHPLIAERIRAGGIEVSPFEDQRIRRYRRPGDSLFLCRRGEAAVELLVPAEEEIPRQIGDFTGVIFFPHGGFFRRFKNSGIDAQLQESIAFVLYELKGEISHEDA